MFRRGCIAIDDGDEPVVFVRTGSDSRLVKEVEKWRLAGRRGLGWSVCVVAVVVLAGGWGCCEGKRDWEWFEK